MQKIVGLVGTKASGKSTAARFLRERHGFVRVPFAKPLKDMLRAIGLTEAEVDGDMKEKPCATLLGRTPRHAMQTLGTDWGRQTIHQGLWLNLWMITAVKAGPRVVVDDVRFENEAKLIRMLGGKLLRIERYSGSLDGRGDLLLGEGLAAALGAEAHVSETELASIECDDSLRNVGTIPDLHAMLDRFLTATGIV